MSVLTSRILLLLAAFALPLLTGCGGGKPQEPPRYVITDVGSGFFPLGGLDISDDGRIVGTTWNEFYSARAFVQQNGRRELLPGLYPAGTSYASAISPDGQTVVGSADSPTGYMHAVRWVGGRIEDLGVFDPDTNTWAVDVNNQGSIAGYAQAASGEEHLILWESQSRQNLGNLGGQTIRPSKIAADGTIVGNSDTQFRESHAFVYRGGLLMDLGTLGGFSSSATGVNGSGQVVGVIENYAGPVEAFLFTGTNMTRLAPLRTGESASVNDINDRGYIVGWATDIRNEFGTPYGLSACLWTAGRAYDLNDLASREEGWFLTHATAINNIGQIVGYGYLRGEYRVLLLTPDRS